MRAVLRDIVRRSARTRRPLAERVKFGIGVSVQEGMRDRGCLCKWAVVRRV